MIDQRHGPLPILLLGLTALTGMVDAVSYLRLGHVFIANMTGNIVFLGFAAAGIRDFSVASSLLAIAAFLAGAFLGGRMGRSRNHRGHLFWLATAIETVLVAVALVLAVTLQDRLHDVVNAGLIALLGIMMGLQNAVARRLAVPDLTTTVLTLTLTGIAADHGATKTTLLRRALSVSAMFLGAAVGGLLVIWMNVIAVLGLALALLLLLAAFGLRARKADHAWTTP
jgi:uncharacterized membrane protein YoaK (UPF0700 family)